MGIRHAGLSSIEVRAGRILYGTGQVDKTRRIAADAGHLPAGSQIVSENVRSASNNCFQCRVTRAGS